MHFMTSFWFSLVLFILFSPLFSPHFAFYFFTSSLIDRIDILLDFRSILIEFLVHMLSPCFLVFSLQVWPFSGPRIARYGLRDKLEKPRELEVRPHWAGDVRTQWCARKTNWCTCTFSRFRRQKTDRHGAPAPSQRCAHTIWREILILRQKGEVRLHLLVVCLHLLVVRLHLLLVRPCLLLVRLHPSFPKRKKSSLH